MNKNQNQHSNNKKQNRSIKFRGKCKSTGKWYYGHYYIEYPPINPIRLNDDPEEKNKEKHWIVFAGFADWNMPRMQQVEVDPETVGQYTCLKDKKKVEIYESDILEWHEENGRFKYRGVVSIEPGFVQLKDYLGTERILFKLMNYYHVEVIGNIHQNPDMLEVKDNG